MREVQCSAYPLRARWDGYLRCRGNANGESGMRPDPIRSSSAGCAPQSSTLVVVLLAPDDLGRIRRVKAKPLRGRFASLDPAPPAKRRQLRGGRERFSRRRSAVRPVNGSVNETGRNRSESGETRQ